MFSKPFVRTRPRRRTQHLQQSSCSSGIQRFTRYQFHLPISRYQFQGTGPTNVIVPLALPQYTCKYEYSIRSTGNNNCIVLADSSQGCIFQHQPRKSSLPQTHVIWFSRRSPGLLLNTGPHRKGYLLPARPSTEVDGRGNLRRSCPGTTATATAR